MILHYIIQYQITPFSVFSLHKLQHAGSLHFYSLESVIPIYHFQLHLVAARLLSGSSYSAESHISAELV